jgi:hypothetical protein
LVGGRDQGEKVKIVVRYLVSYGLMNDPFV